MRIGLGFFNAGASHSYSSIVRLAQQAEALGYDSLWVTEREPFPMSAQARQSRYNGDLVVSGREIDDPMGALAVAAINTERIRLGISLPNVPFYSPVDVGRRLAALDVLSDGRVQLGLGLGWSPAEFRTVGAALARSDSPASEFVQSLRLVWSGDDVRFCGDHYCFDQSASGVVPIQRPAPAMSLMAFAPAAVQRPATLLRGGSPVLATSSVDEMTDALLEIAEAPVVRSGGYDLAVRALVRPTAGPVGESRAMFTGSLDQIRDDIAFVYQIGATELQLDLCRLQMSDQASMLDLLAALADLVPAAVRSPKLEVALAA